jgi:hypothetical protein
MAGFAGPREAIPAGCVVISDFVDRRERARRPGSEANIVNTL